MSDDPADSEGSLLRRHEEFIKSFFKRGAEFAEELLRENEKLRFRAVELEARVRAAELGAPPTEALRELLARIELLEKEREILLHSRDSVQQENADWKARFLEVERENSNLANLYVASYQLHSTLDLKEVIHIILEILLNFVGAKTFAIYLIEDTDQTLHPIAAHSVALGEVPVINVGEGLIGRVVQSGDSHFEGAVWSHARDLAHPLVVTPLRFKSEIVGAIAIWDFLVQKTALAEVDYELLGLLAAHAASALLAAKRIADSGGRPLRLSELRDWL